MIALRRLVAALISLYLLAAVAVYLGQRELVFSTSEERVLPEELGLADIKEVTLHTTGGERLYSWYGSATPGYPTVLYLHGNGGSVSSRQAIQRQFLKQGYGIFMVGYPGYGGSEGNPSEQSLVGAAHLGWSYLRTSGIAPEAIVIFGESLGTAVAIQLAARERAAALVLASPMSSIRKIAEMQYPMFPIGILLKDPFVSTDYIADIDMPLLVFHGSDDQAIPISSGKELFDHAREPKRFYTIEGAGHNNLFDYPILAHMASFLQESNSI